MPLAEISQGPNAFEEFLDRNQKNLIILAILLALGAAGLVVYRGIEQSKQNTAGEALNKAEDLASLQAVVSQHPGTNAALSAAVLLADRQWTEGQQDAAIETLRSFVSANPDHPAHPAAQASLGAKLMAQGKSGDAAKVFEEIVDDPKARYIAPFALISLGDIAKAAGELDKAEASYNRVKSDFSDSNFAKPATDRIATLRAKAPVEIAAPPKSATTETPADPLSAIKAALPAGVNVTSAPAGSEAPAGDAPPQESAPAKP